MVAAADSLTPGTPIGPYSVVRLIGTGHFGAVYQARASDGRLVAVKCLHPVEGSATRRDMLARFEREGALCRTLVSPHIVPVTDHGVDGRVGPFLVMRLLRGTNLQDWLAARGSFDGPTAVAIGLQICAGLSIAHAQGVIHRDLKPENVFLDENESGELTTVVCDFGLAKICDDSGKLLQAGLTASGALLGTPYYMSPEQLLDSKRVDVRSDIWSLGMMLFHVLAGVPALGHLKSFGEVVFALAKGEVMPLAEKAPAVPPALARVIDWALQPIDARCPTVDAFANALFQACRPSPVLHVARVSSPPP